MKNEARFCLEPTDLFGVSSWKDAESGWRVSVVVDDWSSSEHVRGIEGHWEVQDYGMCR